MSTLLYLQKQEPAGQPAQPFRLHDYKPDDGGGRLHGPSTLAKLQLVTLEVQGPDTAGEFVPVSFDEQKGNMSIERFLANTKASPLPVTGQAPPQQEATQMTQLLKSIDKTLQQIREDNLAHQDDDEEAHSESTSMSVRANDDFKNDAIQFYNAAVDPATDANVPADHIWCHITKAFHPRRLVCAAHLYPYNRRRSALKHVAIINVNDSRNCALILKPFEEAFDAKYLIILVMKRAGVEVYVPVWLGPEDTVLTNPKTWPWRKAKETMTTEDQTYLRRCFANKTFKQLVEECQELHFRTSDHRPFKRCLSYQASRAVRLAVVEGRLSPAAARDLNCRFHSPVASSVLEIQNKRLQEYLTTNEAGAEDQQDVSSARSGVGDEE